MTIYPMAVTLADISLKLSHGMQLCVYHSFSALQRKLPTRVAFKGKALRHKRIGIIERGFATDVRNTLTTSVRLQALLPQILPKERFPAWNQTLKHVLTQNGVERPKRIAVYGLDRLADPHSLAMALLDDPFAPLGDSKGTSRSEQDETRDSSVSKAFKETSSRVEISCVESKLPRLTPFNAEILEIPSLNPDSLPLLWSADVRLLVATPLVTPLTPDFLSLISRPSTLLIVQFTENNPNIVHHTLSSLTYLQPEMMSSTVVHAVNSAKALSASDAFRRNPSTLDSVDTFQRDYLDSGVSSIIEKVHSLLSMPKDVLEGKKSASIVIGTLDACYESIRLSKNDIYAAIEQVKRLQLSADSIRGKAELGATKGPYQLNVSDSVRKSTQRMSDVFLQISWWKLPLIVDDLSHTFIDVVQRTWCSDLVSRINYQAGRLSLLREQAISQTVNCYTQLPKPFQSAVLKNILEQHSSELSEIGPGTLSHPVTYRIKQLNEPVTRLHRQVQNALLASYCGVLGSFSTAYIVWYWQYSTGHNAIGLGALGIAIVLRLFMRRWEKVKKKWWADWHRAGQGLERDMKDTLEKTTEKNVLTVPLKAIEMLQEVVEKRANELEAIQKELDRIKLGFRSHKDKHASVNTP